MTSKLAVTAKYGPGAVQYPEYEDKVVEKVTEILERFLDERFEKLGVVTSDGVKEMYSTTSCGKEAQNNLHLSVNIITEFGGVSFSAYFADSRGNEDGHSVVWFTLESSKLVRNGQPASWIAWQEETDPVKSRDLEPDWVQTSWVEDELYVPAQRWYFDEAGLKAALDWALGWLREHMERFEDSWAASEYFAKHGGETGLEGM
jgi:hypothetical protein